MSNQRYTMIIGAMLVPAGTEAEEKAIEDQVTEWANKGSAGLQKSVWVSNYRRAMSGQIVEVPKRLLLSRITGTPEEMQDFMSKKLMETLRVLQENAPEAETHVAEAID